MLGVIERRQSVGIVGNSGSLWKPHTSRSCNAVSTLHAPLLPSKSNQSISALSIYQPINHEAISIAGARRHLSSSIGGRPDVSGVRHYL